MWIHQANTSVGRGLRARSWSSFPTAFFMVVGLSASPLVLLLLCPPAAGAGTFEATMNATSLARIYNASDVDDNWLGFSCASIGDFNGDGIGDIAVGAPGASNDIGRAYIIYGNTSGFDKDFDLSNIENRDFVGLVLSGSNGGNFSNNIGYAVAAAGDVNGDHLMDVMVGAYGSSYFSEGAAYVVYGTNTSEAYDASFLDLGGGGDGGLDELDGFILTGVMVQKELYAELLQDTLDRQMSLQYTGNLLSAAGDVNGDGYSDILVGSPTAGTGSEGNTYLLFGGINLPARLDLQASDDASSVNEGVVVFKGASRDEAGYSCSGGFDINGDGFSDFIIGAPFGGTVGQSEGGAYVVFGQENLADSDTVMLDTELDGSNGFHIMGPSRDAFAGVAVAGIGDVNGDGYDDIIIGASGVEPEGRYRAGAAYVVFGMAEGDFAASYDLGNADIIDGNVVTSFLGMRAEDALGIGVGPAGDINGDGIADVWYQLRASEDFSAALSMLDTPLRFVCSPYCTDLLEVSPADIAGPLRCGANVRQRDVVGAPTSDSDALQDAGSVFVVFGWQDDGEGSPWGDSVDLSGLDGSNGFSLIGSTADGHFGWAGAANVDLNGDDVSDLLIGAFLAPGLYIVTGEDGAIDRSTAIILAIVSGVLGCLCCLAREARIWLSHREAKAAERQKLAEGEQASTGSKVEASEDKASASIRDINQGCKVIDAEKGA